MPEKNDKNPVTANIPDMSRDAMNAFPFWFPKICNAGIEGLKIPKSVCIHVPDKVRRAFYMEDPDDWAVIEDFVEGDVRKAIRENGFGLVFLKNGGYSHKFDASRACLPIMSDLTHAVLTIMNEAMLRCGFQYDGTESLVVRERIQHDPRAVPCIYNGLPFRTEYRVFYDFDRQRPIFTVDYWDRDYVYPNLHDMTDQLVYDAWYPTVRRRYDGNWERVQDLVSKAMSRVDGLSGPWSVDVMQDENDGLWLIDMAVAEMSAYWSRCPAGWTPLEAKP